MFIFIRFNLRFAYVTAPAAIYPLHHQPRKMYF